MKLKSQMTANKTPKGQPDPATNGIKVGNDALSHSFQFPVFGGMFLF